MRCVGSVLKAIGPDDEVVLVDDGSVEARRVDRAWWADSRVRVIYKENGGLSSARNAALEVIRGKYVTFVDSDDEVLPETFERCIGRLEKTGYDIAIYGVKVIWVDERLTKTDAPEDADVGRLMPEGLMGLIRKRVFNYACNKVYSTEFLSGVRTGEMPLRFDLKGMPCEDAVFNLTCLMRGATYCTLAYPGYVYYRTGNTLLSRYRPSNYAGWKLSSDTWIAYKDATPGARTVVGSFGELDIPWLKWSEWGNLWLPGSPLSWGSRYQWLKENRGELLKKPKGVIGKALRISMVFGFVTSAVYYFLRRHLYCAVIRRRHIQRCFPTVERMD